MSAKKIDWILAPDSFDRVHESDTTFILCPVLIARDGNTYHIPIAYSPGNITKKVNGMHVLTHKAGAHFDQLAENVRYMTPSVICEKVGNVELARLREYSHALRREGFEPIHFG